MPFLTQASRGMIDLSISTVDPGLLTVFGLQTFHSNTSSDFRTTCIGLGIQGHEAIMTLILFSLCFGIGWRLSEFLKTKESGSGQQSQTPDSSRSRLTKCNDVFLLWTNCIQSFYIDLRDHHSCFIWGYLAWPFVPGSGCSPVFNQPFYFKVCQKAFTHIK